MTDLRLIWDIGGAQSGEPIFGLRMLWRITIHALAVPATKSAAHAITTFPIYGSPLCWPDC